MNREHQLTLEDILENLKELNKYIEELGFQEICKVEYDEDKKKYKFIQMIAVFEVEYSEEEEKFKPKEGYKPMNSVEYTDEIMMILTEINLITMSLSKR